MIDRVHFENFKSLKDVTIDLGRLTVLVGPNGCGKSSVLQGIHLLSQTGLARKATERKKAQGWHRFSAIFGGARDPRRLTSPDRPTSLRFAMRDIGGDELSLAIVVPAISDEDPTGERFEFQVAVAGPEGALSSFIPPKKGENASLVLDHPRVRQFVSVVYLHLNATEMTSTSIPEDEKPRMRFDGSGLASTLAWMKGAAEEDLAEITRDLGRIVPGVRRIRTLRESVLQRSMEKLSVDNQPVWRPIEKAVIGDRFEIEFDDGSAIPADLLSEGTVLALGLITKLREPKRPRLVLLDDIDRGLHIEAQAKLVQVLRDLLKLDPDLQILCTTHSPYLLDLFEPGEVRVLALDDKRHAHALALSAHPEFSKWRFGTQTGELWAALGDAWVAGAQEPNQ